MKLLLHNNLRSPQIIDATRLLVTHDNGTPLALFLDHGNGQVTVSSIQEPNEFKQLLKQHGILQAIQVVDIQGPEAR